MNSLINIESVSSIEMCRLISTPNGYSEKHYAFQIIFCSDGTDNANHILLKRIFSTSNQDNPNAWHHTLAQHSHMHFFE